jgi:hypothetical protein
MYHVEKVEVSSLEMENEEKNLTFYEEVLPRTTKKAICHVAGFKIR